MRPFRFGIHLWTLPADDWRARARRYEALGFSSVTITDHLVVAQWEPFTALAAIAAVTERLHVGPLVTDTGLHNPAVLAKAAATVQVMSGGRFELGLGGGYVARNFAAAGLPFPPASERIRRLEETITALRSIWTQESTTVAGATVTLDAVPRALDAPVTVPVLVGGGGPKVMAVAGRQADIASMIPRQPSGDWAVAESIADSTDARMEEKSRWVDDAARAAGRDPEAIERNTMVFRVAVGGDVDAARDRLAAEDGVPVEATTESSLYLTGSGAEVRDRLEARRARTGLSYYSVFDPGPEQVERLAAEVVAPLAGR